jgi:hypothetical protein
MDDEVMVVVEGMNGTVMKINEIQVRKTKEEALIEMYCYVIGGRKDISSISSPKSSLSS